TRGAQPRSGGSASGTASLAPAGGATPAGGAGPAATAGGAVPARTAGSDTAGTAEWTALVNQLDLTGAARQLAAHLRLIGRRGAGVRLALDPRNQLVRTAATEDKLSQALSRHFGAPVRLEFQAGGSGAETPAAQAQRASDTELAAARRAFEDDPAVKGLRER